MYTLNSTTLNKVIGLNKVQLRELNKIKSAESRQAVANDWLAENEKKAIESEAAFAPIRAARQHNKNVFSVELMPSGLVKITGLGTNRPAFLSKAGVQRLISEGVTKLNAILPTMPEVPTYPKKA